MSRVRSTNNRAETALRKRLWQHGLRYRLYRRDLPGRPDLVFVSARAVVFLDGDYWHARLLREQGEEALRRSLSTQRREWWIEKLKKTCLRDDAVDAELLEGGWSVCRVWEKDFIQHGDEITGQVLKFVRDARRRRDAAVNLQPDPAYLRIKAAGTDGQ